MSGAAAGDRSDRVAAWATGAGIGLVVLMVGWLVGNRLAGLVWDAPAGPIVAMAFAVAAGLTSAISFGSRLARKVRSELPPAR